MSITMPVVKWLRRILRPPRDRGTTETGTPTLSPKGTGPEPVRAARECRCEDDPGDASDKPKLRLRLRLADEAIATLQSRGFARVVVPLSADRAEVEALESKVDGRLVRITGDAYQLTVTVEFAAPAVLDDLEIVQRWERRSEHTTVPTGDTAFDERFAVASTQEASAAAAATWLPERARRALLEIQAYSLSVSEGVVRLYSLDRDAETDHVAALGRDLAVIHQIVAAAAALDNERQPGQEDPE